jgi:ketosteroid isomerase-like protein
MTKYLTAACILCGGLSLTTIPSSAQMPTVTGSPAIADTIAQLFAGIAEATSALDFDRLLGYYEESDALTYVAQGQVIRSHDAFSKVLDTQLRGLVGADLRWLETYVDVLSSDVAVATATYAFTALLPDGGSLRTTGTYMCIYVLREGRWQVRYSSHTFPQPRP